MPLPKGKEKFVLWARPETLKRVEELYETNGDKTRSEFIEKAIEFYCGYLTAENYKEYFPDVIVSTMQGTLDSLENRMARLLFKLAVEQAMMLHVVAATNRIDRDTLSELRGMCVMDCKKINGAISFDDAVKYQKDDAEN